MATEQHEILERVYSVPEELDESYRLGLYCGLEDRGIADRYEAATYGYDQALQYAWSILRHAFPNSSPGEWRAAIAAAQASTP